MSGSESIGKIPKEWEVVKLQDVTLKAKSLDASTLSEFDYVDISSIDNQTFKITNWAHLKGKQAPSRARRLIRKDDILFATTRPYLKNIAIVPPELDGQICSTGFCVIRADRSKAEPHWIFYYVQTDRFVKRIAAKMKGATYPAVADKDVLMEKILLPPLPEQKRIAEILRTVDEGVEKVEQEIEHTERLKKGLMQRLLTRGIGHKEFKDSPIGKIPRDWEVVRLKDIGELQDGDWILKENYVDSGVRLIQVGDIGVGRFLNKSKRFISLERAEELRCKFVDSENHILISRMPDPIGRACLAPKLPYPYIVAVDITMFKPDLDQADRLFLIYVLNFGKTLKRMNKLAVGATRKRISRKNLEQFKIPLPSLPEQKRIAEILETVDRKLELLRQKKEQLQRIKKGLMNELLTGRRRVKVHHAEV